MSYTIIREWTDDCGNKWFTVRWSSGAITTHSLPM